MAKTRPFRRVTGKGSKPIAAKTPTASARLTSFVRSAGAGRGPFIALRPPRRMIVPLTAMGTGPIKVKVAKPERPYEPRTVSVPGSGKTFTVKPGLRPARKGKVRWKSTTPRPEGFTRVSVDSPPDPIEAFIDLEVPGVYHLIRASEKQPDHDSEGECKHPKNASSFVSCIGLVVLKQGKIGIFAEFWNNGGQIVYTFGNDDHAIELYKIWRDARSKGKWLHRMIYNNPYVRIK